MIEKKIEARRMNFSVPTTERVIVAVSGGADSVALVRLLYESGYDLIAAHCNFHLRGEESNRDQRFVESICEEMEIPLRIVHFETKEFASIRHLSIEMAARELRYDWFRTLRLREGVKYVAVAHHSDDVIETFLINLSRGTGLRGLSGMREFNDYIWRPLLKVSRADILAYLHSHGWNHVEDSTNEENFCARNKNRNKVIPMMEEMFPQWKHAVMQTIQNLDSTERYLAFHLSKDLSGLLEEKISLMGKRFYSISLSKLENYGEGSSFLLYEALKKYGFSSETTKSIETIFLKSEGQNSIGKLFESSDGLFVALRNDDSIEIVPNGNNGELEGPKEYLIGEVSEESESGCPIQCPIQWKTISKSKWKVDRTNEVCAVDLSKLRFPLRLRRWRDGDWLIPFGMKGRKKVSDLLIDNKIRIYDKRNLWILTMGEASEEQVVWVVGVRPDNRFRVDESTETVMIFSVSSSSK